MHNDPLPQIKKDGILNFSILLVELLKEDCMY